MANWHPGAEIRRELPRGEEVRWLGAQSRGSLALRAVPAIVIGVGFVAAASVGIPNLLSRTDDDLWGYGMVAFAALFALAGVVFTGSGLAGVFGLVQVAYAVTDRRLLIVRRSLRRQVSEYGPQDIQGVERSERGDGSGNIIFRRDAETSSEGQRVSKVGFFGVQGVRAAAAAIEGLRGRDRLRQG